MADVMVPDWRTCTAGARIRAALWLHSEVGVGSTFTKADLRAAFPGVEQIDRRMRDLRPEGWIITTYREDPSLDSDELRLVAEGGAVWERGYRSRRDGQPTDQDRQAAFIADNYACVYCGIAGGEAYPDDELRNARLSAVRVRPGTSDDVALLTLCDRCRVAVVRDVVEDHLLDEIANLDPGERRRLLEWIERGERTWTSAERLWSRFRRLPATRRGELRREL